MPPPTVRVFNGGRNGVTPAFHVGLAAQYKAIFKPDWVVIMVEDDRWKAMLGGFGHEIYYRPAQAGFAIKQDWQVHRKPRYYWLLRKWHIRDLALFDWAFSRWTLMNTPAAGPESPAGGGEAAPAAANAPDGANAPTATNVANATDALTATNAADGAKPGSNSAVTKSVIDWTLQQLKQKYPNLVIVHLPSGQSASAGLVAPQPEEKLLAEYCRELPHWSVVEDGAAITRTFRFADYYRTMAFVNALAYVAHAQDHHPDLGVHYDRCVVRYSTHDVGGLSENDFICAAKADALLG
jgi:4a-hydroxytetrahydrobiopterin dehydratase